MKIARRNVSKKALTKFGPYLMRTSIAIVIIIEIMQFLSCIYHNMLSDKYIIHTYTCTYIYI